MLFAAFHLGRRERRRLGIIELEHDQDLEHFSEFRLGDWRFLFNAALTLGLIAAMMLNLMPISVLFIIALSLGLLVNFPSLKEQKAVIGKHADNVLAVTLLIFAAGIFVGVMSGTGMVKAISTSLVAVIPDSAGHFMSVFTAFISMPFTYVLTNDACLLYTSPSPRD